MENRKEIYLIEKNRTIYCDVQFTLDLHTKISVRIGNGKLVIHANTEDNQTLVEYFEHKVKHINDPFSRLLFKFEVYIDGESEILRLGGCNLTEVEHIDNNMVKYTISSDTYHWVTELPPSAIKRKREKLINTINEWT